MNHRLSLCPLSLLLGVTVMFTAIAAQEGGSDEEIRPHDTVVFRNAAGAEERVVGQILAERFDAIDFRVLTGGSFTLPRSGIVEIIRRRSKEEVYRTKRGKIPRPSADPDVRARANLELGLWCRTAQPSLGGAPPAPEEAFGHLLKAVQLRPDLHAAYPHLLDILAERREAMVRAAGAVAVTDEEVQVFSLAQRGGYTHPEIDFRLGEIYLQSDLPERAEERFQAVLAAEEPRNQSLRRRARQYLAQVQLSRGEWEHALDLYRPDPAATADEAFESYYLGARILLSRGGAENRVLARDYLEKAGELQPEFAGVDLELASLDFLDGDLQGAYNRLQRALATYPDDPELRSGMGLVQLERGRLAAAETELRRALELLAALKRTAEWTDRHVIAESQSHLGLGAILEFRGRAAEAAVEYRLALDARPANAVAALFLAGAVAAGGALDEATELLRREIAAGGDDPALFVARARVLAEIELARGAEDRALHLLGYAAGLDASDPSLHATLGHLLLRKGLIEAARGHLETALKQEGGETPGLLCALAYDHYARGDMAAAEDAFRRVLKLVPAPRKSSAGAAPPVPETRLYAERGLAAVLDTRELEVWEDGFAREDGEEIQRGWLKHENYGIRVTLSDGAVLFAGTQANESDGVTRLYREVDTGDAERISVRLRIPAGSRVRAGVRLETPEDTVGVGLVFFRDFDGGVRFALKTSRSDWEDARPTTETDPSLGKLIYQGTARWPEDSNFHTLAIRKATAEKGAKGYDLLLDREYVARNVPLGDFGRRTKVLRVGVSGQADALGASYSFEVDDFRVYRRRATTSRPGQR